MKNWKAEFYCDEISKEIKTQYRLLLSIGLNDQQAEDRIVSYLISNAARSGWDEGMLWLALALTEWDWGRLSSGVKEKAQQWMRMPNAPFSQKALDNLGLVLNTSIPQPKTVRCAAVRKCPWKTGSLLAYKIATNTEMASSIYWNKYVLLRVMTVNRHPISYLAPDLLHNESMVVALYHWVGDSAPNLNDVANLKFTPISVREPMLSKQIAYSFLNKASPYPELSDRLAKIVTSDRVEYCYTLDWGNKKEQSSVFTCIGSNILEGVVVPTLHDIKAGSNLLVGLSCFDIVLIKRLETIFG